VVLDKDRANELKLSPGRIEPADINLLRDEAPELGLLLARHGIGRENPDERHQGGQGGSVHC
jgi:hypothetical protein